MDSSLIGYYYRSLDYLRKAGEDFAQKHPKLAHHLKINDTHAPDPHTERLIESFAFLDARIQQRLDQDIFSISEAMLRIYYPHYLAPIPSCGIVQFKTSSDQEAAELLPKNFAIETDANHHEKCQFKTVYPVNIYPLGINDISYLLQPFAENISTFNNVKSILKVDFKTLSEDITISELDINKLRFYISSQQETKYRIYEYLFSKCCSLTLKSNNSEFQLNTSNICKVGYTEQESLLKYSAQTLLCHKLLLEQSVFPEKFLFFDVSIPESIRQQCNNQVSLLFHFNDYDQNILSIISPELLKLNCSPVVNIFQQSAEPIRLCKTKVQYPLIPDYRDRKSKEIYSIKNVTLADNSKTEKCYEIFSCNHYMNDKDINYYNVSGNTTDHESISNEPHKLMIEFSDVNFSILHSDSMVANIDLLCTNGQIPNEISTNSKHVCFQQSIPSYKLSSIKLINGFTPSYRFPIAKQNLWKIVSHISINACFFFDDNNMLASLKEHLSLYEFRNKSNSRDLVNKFKKITTSKIYKIINQSDLIYPGYLITIVIDDCIKLDPFIYLYLSIVHSYFSSFCPINHFYELIIKTFNEHQIIYQWEPWLGKCQIL